MSDRLENIYNYCLAFSGYVLQPYTNKTTLLRGRRVHGLETAFHNVQKMMEQSKTTYLEFLCFISRKV